MANTTQKSKINLDIHVAFALTGRAYAGKDYVAAQAGATPVSIAEPLYAIGKAFFGPQADKSLPGMREFYQRVGQWGWGFFDDKTYQATPDRASFIGFIRRNGQAMATQGGLPGSCVDWDTFGVNRRIWIDAAVARTAERLAREKTPQIVAFTNIRFAHELDAMKEAGIPVFHVYATEQARQGRQAAAGHSGRFIAGTEIEPSEMLAASLDEAAIAPRLTTAQGTILAYINRIVVNDRIRVARDGMVVTTFAQMIRASLDKRLGVR